MTSEPKESNKSKWKISSGLAVCHYELLTDRDPIIHLLPLKFSEACFMTLPDLETLQVKRLRGVMRTCEYSLRCLLLIQNMMTFKCFKVNQFFVDVYDVICRNIVLKSVAVPYSSHCGYLPLLPGVMLWQGSCFVFSSAIKPCNSNMPDKIAIPRLQQRKHGSSKQRTDRACDP